MAVDGSRLDPPFSDPLNRPPFRHLPNHGERILPQDERIGETRLSNAHTREVKFAVSHHASPGKKISDVIPAPIFDLRQPKFTNNDLKAANAVWAEAGEHFAQGPAWVSKTRKPVLTVESLRSRVADLLDTQTKPLPAMSPRRTQAPSAPPGSAAAAAFNSAVAQQEEAATAGPRGIGSARSTQRWSAYATVTAPFASPIVVHQPEHPVALAVTQAGSTAAVAATGLPATGTTQLSSAATLALEHAATSRVLTSRAAAVVAATRPGSGSAAAAAAAAAVTGVGVIDRTTRGTATTSLLSALLTADNHWHAGEKARVAAQTAGTAALAGTASSASASASLTGRQASEAAQAAQRLSADRRQQLASRGRHVDFRDESTVHALTSSQVAQVAAAEQSRLLHSRGLPVAQPVDALPTGLSISAARAKGAVGAVATSTLRAATADPAASGRRRGSGVAGASAAAAPPPRRYDAYGNVSRAAEGYRPQWVAHTVGNESDAAILRRDLPVELNKGDDDRAFAAAAAEGHAAAQRRMRMRVWAPSPANPEPAPEYATVLDQPLFQTRFAAQIATQSGSAASATGDGEARPSSRGPEQLYESLRNLTSGPMPDGDIDEDALAAADGSRPKSALGRPPTAPAAPAAVPAKPDARYLSGAPSLADTMRALAADAALPTTSGASAAASALPGEPGLSSGPSGTLRMAPLPFHRRAVGVGATRPPVSEDDERERYPAAEGVDPADARQLLDAAVATAFPFYGHKRAVEHSQAVLAQHAQHAPHVVAVAGADAGATPRDLSATVTATAGSSATTNTVILQVPGAGQQQRSSAFSAVNPAATIASATGGAGGGGETLRGLLSGTRAVTAAAPATSQAPPSTLRQSRTLTHTATADTYRGERTLRTAAGGGKGAHTLGWQAFMGKSLALAGDAAAYTTLQLGTLHADVDYGYPLRIRNTTPFTRRYRVVAAGLSDTPSGARGTLHVRFRSQAIAPGLTFTLVVVIRGAEPGLFSGYVHLQSDDGEYMPLTFTGSVLDGPRFMSARDDARATGRLDTLRSTLAKLHASAVEWDTTYRSNAGAGSANSSTLSELIRAAGGSSGSRGSSRSPSPNSRAGSPPPPQQPVPGLEVVTAALNTIAANNGPDFLPSGRGRTLRPGLGAPAAPLNRYAGPAPGGVSRAAADRNQLMLSPHTTELPPGSMGTLQEGEEQGMNAETAVGSDDIEGGGYGYGSSTGGHGGHGEGAGEGRDLSPSVLDRESPTTVLLHMSQRASTTPGALLEASLAPGAAAAAAAAARSRSGAGGARSTDGSGKDAGKASSTAAQRVFQAALMQDKPIYVGEFPIVPVPVESIPMPRIADQLAQTAAGMQGRVEPLRAHVPVGLKPEVREQTLRLMLGPDAPLPSPRAAAAPSRSRSGSPTSPAPYAPHLSPQDYVIPHNGTHPLLLPIV